MDQRDVCREAGDSLVDVLESLQVGEVHEGEESLLERVRDRSRGIQDLIEAFLDELRHFQWMVNRAFDAYRNAPQATDGLGVGQQVVREQGVQIQDGVPVEADLVGLVNEQFDGCLVVQDHLRFPRVLALGGFAQLQQTLGFQQGVGVAFQTAGVPGQVDQQAAVDRPGVGTRWVLAVGRTAYFE